MMSCVGGLTPYCYRPLSSSLGLTCIEICYALMLMTI